VSDKEAHGLAFLFGFRHTGRRKEKAMVASAVIHQLLKEDRFASVRALLQRHGVHADDPDTLLRVMRTEGWHVDEQFADGQWIVTVSEGDADGIEIAEGNDADRGIAMLRALRDATLWLSPKQELELFDLQTRDLLGISAEEFRSRWQSNTLPVDDPRVSHLLLVFPVEWQSAK